MSRTSRGWRFLDLIFLGYLLALSALVVAFRSRAPRWPALVGGHALAGLGVAALATWGRPRPLRELYPLLVLPFAYEEIGWLVHLVWPRFLDPWVQAAEVRLLGAVSNRYLEPLVRPWLTEYCKASYFSYYLMVPVPALWLYMRGERQECCRFLTRVSLALCASYLLFVLVPVAGPRFFLPPVELRGYWITRLQDALTAMGALKGGAMPSSHVAVAFVFRDWASHRLPRLRPLWTFAALSLAASAVYTHDHYLLDVVAGALLGLAVPRLSRRGEERWPCA